MVQEQKDCLQPWTWRTSLGISMFRNFAIFAAISQLRPVSTAMRPSMLERRSFYVLEIKIPEDPIARTHFRNFRRTQQRLLHRLRGRSSHRRRRATHSLVPPAKARNKRMKPVERRMLDSSVRRNSLFVGSVARESRGPGRRARDNQNVEIRQ